jgi:hypothetical protein
MIIPLSSILKKVDHCVNMLKGLDVSTQSILGHFWLRPSILSSRNIVATIRDQAAPLDTASGLLGMLASVPCRLNKLGGDLWIAIWMLIF